MLNFNNTRFITSAPHIGKLPPDSGIEVAFIGRSNAGKSSALNAITNIKNLAKTSKTPGRTQLINLFEVKEDCRIVDLPGYGFAQVPLAVKNKWQKSLTEYLQKRKSLRALVLIMDIRHPLKDLDRQIMTWASLSNIEVLILLTKADKLKLNELKSALLNVKKSMVEFGSSYKIVPFSSLNRTGVDEVRQILSDFYETFHGYSQSEQEGLEYDAEQSDMKEGETVFDDEAWNRYKQE
ncbi:ribosome biogenesis GTP-binding protein YihA/YsxC [Succinimonas amylolytica]|uniref:ribosome biogenesis GTP-binding protein YihA/YsxC n=1 Tax=Succinimonas amylolytica TaxID=83769 RepID=UPI0003618C32|nr:ribosome biogenesis GTP-binding protein YihA/YsxC [Succinimonas amylolytica]